MTTISIALATYNGERFLREQLESLAKQSRLPDELIVADDGSTDRTLEIVRHFAATSPFSTVLIPNEGRLGWRANFIRAASLCRHNLIAFCDQDDIRYESKLSQVEELFFDLSTILVHHNANLVDGGGTSLGLLDQPGSYSPVQERLERPTTWANPLGLTIAFRRDLLAFIPYWPLSLDPTTLDTPAAHDQFFYKLATNLGRVRYTATPLLAYRQHGGNAVGFGHQHSRSLRDKVPALRRVEPELRMMDCFCRLLAAGQEFGPPAFDRSLSEALAKNAIYRDRLALIDLAQSDRLLIRRARHFLALASSEFFKRSATWRIGYKAVLTAGFMGVLLGHKCGLHQ